MQMFIVAPRRWCQTAALNRAMRPTSDLGQDTLSSSSPLLGVMVFLSLAGAVPLFICYLTGSSPVYGAWRWALVITTFSGAQYATLIANGAPSAFRMSFWLFGYVFFGLAPLAQLRTGHLTATTPGLETEQFPRAFLLILVGMVAFSIGSMTRGYSSESRHSVGLLVVGLRPQRVYAGTLLSLVLASYYVTKVGPATFFTARDVFGHRIHLLWPDATNASLVSGLAIFPLLICIAAITTLRRQDPSQRNLRSASLLAVAVVMMLVMVNPLTSPRQVFGTVILSLIAVAGAFSTPRRFRWSAILVLASMVFVFPYADYFRRSESYGLLAKGGTLSALSNGDYDSFGQIVNTLTYVEQHGFTYGGQALGSALFWVPRSVWPGKPIDTGILLAQNRGYDFTNLSAPLWAELFINGGWLVLIVGMCIIGRVARLHDLREWTLTSRANLLNLVIPFYMIILLRGSLLQATAGLALFVAADRAIRSPHLASVSPGDPTRNPVDPQNVRGVGQFMP